MGKRKWWAITAVFVCIIIGLVLLYNLKLQQNEKIIGNISIEGIQVCGMSKEEAALKLRSKGEEILKKKVIFKCLDREFSASFSEAGVEVDVSGALEQALQWGKKNNTLLLNNKKEYSLKIPLRLNEKTARGYFEKIAAEVNRSPVEAKYIIKNGKYSIIPSTLGQRIDIEATMEGFCRILNTKYTSGSILTVPIVVRTVEPKVKTEDLTKRKINVLRGTFTTEFNEKLSTRVKNIAAAAEAINGKVIPPGSTFSFNDTVGPRTEENGYEEALVIIENEFVAGIGGGVCQVSTTLYNAALKANLGIEERFRHSKLINYAPPGLDAAVAYGLLDLKLSNKSENFMVINAQVNNNSITINIFGEAGIWPKVEIKHYIEKTIQPERIYKYDPEIEEGKEFVEQEGKVGYITRVERICTLGEKIISHEIISEDKYPAEPEIILKGIKKKKSN
ncbi:MAG: hypothetical protein GX088_08145 [Clostridia bacterium]|nr:hypothetical protein [Clostridia bacterium]